MGKPETKSRNREISILVLIVLLAVALRVVAVLLRPMVQLDEAVYARLAENLAAGNGFVDLTGVETVHFAPLFPLIVAALMLVTGSAVLSGYIVVVSFGSLITVATYLLGRDMFGGRTGLMAAALVAVMPLFVDYSSRLYSESVYVFFLMLALFFGWHMLNRPRWQSAAAAGLTLGIAYLTNPSPFYYSLLFLALALAVGIKQGNLQKMARAAAVLAGVFFLLVLPNVLFIHAVSGKWTFTGKKASEHIFTVTHNLRYGTPEWDKEAMTLTDDGREEYLIRHEEGGDIVSFFFQEPAIAAKMFAGQSYQFYSRQIATVIPLWLLPLLGLGLFARAWGKHWGPSIGYITIMLLPVLVILAMYPTDRFFMPFLPLVLILISLGWRRWEEWGSETFSLSLQKAGNGPNSRLAVWLIGALVIVPVAVFGLAHIAATNYETQYREAGEWIRTSAGDGKVIMARWEASSAYYSGGIALPLPYAEYDRLNAYARSREVDYLVISSQAIRDFRPQLTRLLEAEANHPEWRLVHKVMPGTDSEVLIFQLSN